MNGKCICMYVVYVGVVKKECYVDWGFVLWNTYVSLLDVYVTFLYVICAVFVYTFMYEVLFKCWYACDF